MIEAKHNKAADWIFNKYLRKIIKSDFSHFWICNDFPHLEKNKPLIVTPNHISWWDGFFIYLLIKKYTDRKIFVMMLEEQLTKFWFFSKVGAFSIKNDSLSGIREAIKYFSHLLNEENSIIFYPQGKIEQFDKPEIEIKGGIKTFLAHSEKDCNILPVGFRIQYNNERKPEIVCRFGKPLSNKDVLSDFDNYKIEFFDNLARLKNDSINRNFMSDLFTKGI